MLSVQRMLLRMAQLVYPAARLFLRCAVADQVKGGHALAAG